MYKKKRLGTSTNFFSVVLPTNRNLLAIYSTIESIAASARSYHSIELIIINDNFRNSLKKKDLENLLGKKQNISLKMLQAGGHGPSHARNVGLKAARHDFIVCIDDDMRIDLHFFEYLSDMWGKHKNAAAIVPKIAALFLETENKKYVNQVEKHDWCYVQYDLGSRTRYLQLDETFYSACFSLNRKNHYLFNENLGYSYYSFLIGGEDTELSLRIHQSGKKIIYSPKLKAYHLCKNNRLNVFYLLKRYCKAGFENALVSYWNPAAIRVFMQSFTTKNIFRSNIFDTVYIVSFFVSKTLIKLFFNYAK